tara:strand:+ start:120 stop:593 length:474 start_codon:yes stop_codon:yes gene_type:complete
MADLSTTAWTATELGDGWRKWSCSKTWSTTAADTITTPDFPADVKNHLAKGGAVKVGLQLGAGTIGNVTVDVHQDDESTFTSAYSVSLDTDAAASTNYLYGYGDNVNANHTVMPYLRLRLSRASGTAANTTAMDVIYKSDNFSQSKMTIGGVGADPS